jgi:hypothetical protein
MTQISLMVLIGVTVTFVLSAPFLITGGMTAKAQIRTVPMPENGTRLLLNMKDQTQTLVNATTNETISVENFTFYKGNETTNETLPGNAANMTTNETFPGSIGNLTSKVNITEKFRELGK